tara:strand:+ start:59312 stop:60031 length:720 start_codon:yes stop_codon:yes gene_type:complete
MVKLISYTTGIGENSGSLKDIVAYCARVSNPSNQMNKATSSKLIDYLIKHKHWSPFEMVNICLEIETTRDIARQILRHRSFSFQEFSQRYADVRDMSDVFLPRKARLQDPKNRQNSIEADHPNYKSLNDDWYLMQKEVFDKAEEVYNQALKRGIAKEQARAVLPEGLTKSRMYMNGTLRSWLHYIEVRTGNGTQKEHMEIANQCKEIIDGLLKERVIDYGEKHYTEPQIGVENEPNAFK